MGASKFLLLVESSDRNAVRRTKYSLSTKVAESLRSGACIIAYGPGEIASIEYLHRHKAAYILNNAADFPTAIRALCQQYDMYENYVCASRELANAFHDAEKNETYIDDIFVKAINQYSGRGG